MNDAEYRDLIEKAHQLEELKRHRGWQTLETVVGENIEAWNDRLLAGHATTLEQYQRWAGWMSGAKAALDTPDEFSRRVKEEAARRNEQAAAA